MRDVKQAIGRRVRQLRQERKLSQESLAFSAGLDRTYISSVEMGKRNISILNIYKIARALNIRVRELFDHASFD